MRCENIIVISGTKWQIPLINKIKEMGYRAIAFNLYEDSAAFAYADEFRIVDILDVEKCCELAESFSPVAVMSDECDIATPTVAAISEKFGLRSIGIEKAELYTNKYKMRIFGRENRLDTPDFCKCSTLEQAIEFYDLCNKKLIMKPLDSNSSRGVYTIHNRKGIIENFEKSISFSKIEHSVLLEEYIDGTEFTVDGIMTANGHVSLAISEKKHYSYNENIACSLYFSYSNPEYDYEKLREINDAFVNLSGLPFGLTHAEYKYKDGKFYLIEIGARGGGNLISATIVPTVSGVDNYKYLIDKTLGNACDERIGIGEKFKDRCAVLHFFDTDGQEGIVKEICGEEILADNSKVLDYCMYCNVGDRVYKAADDSKRIGYYIAYGDSREELDDLIKTIDVSFDIRLERET